VTLLNSQVQLGGQAAARAAGRVVVRLDADPAGLLLLQVPLFRAPAACWWSRLTVESTSRSQVMSPLASASACSAAKIRRRVPSRCRRRNRSYERAQGPYRYAPPRDAGASAEPYAVDQLPPGPFLMHALVFQP
jgi:hypothetical protein